MDISRIGLDLRQALAHFDRAGLASAARALFRALGYQAETRPLSLTFPEACLTMGNRIEEPGPETYSFREGSPPPALIEVRLAAIGGGSPTGLVVAAALPGESYRRSDLAALTRAINRSTWVPVLFLHGAGLTLAIPAGPPAAAPVKVTLLKDIAWATPAPPDLEALASLAPASRRDPGPVELAATWAAVVDNAELSRRFSRCVSEWTGQAGEDGRLALTGLLLERLVERFVWGSDLVHLSGNKPTVLDRGRRTADGGQRSAVGGLEPLAGLRPNVLAPLPPLLSGFKFTLAEPAPLEAEYALGPEVLGQVFEELLAAEMAPAGRTTRRQTGSFYTPPDIVDYMVDESLVTWLAEQLAGPVKDGRERLRALLAGPAEPPLFTEVELDCLVEAIAGLRLLDPACGCGAFLLAALHRLVRLLARLDPANRRWRAAQHRREPGCSAEVERVFSGAEPDYARKFYLIKRCLHGVDIQPAAAGITRLRCWLALLADHRPGPDSGPPAWPTPGLVVADALVSLAGPEASFDVVIGNPPYLNVNELKRVSRAYRHLYETAYGSYDLYVLFFELAARLARPGGLVCLLTSNKYLVADYGARLRRLLHTRLALLKLLDLAGCRRIFAGTLVSLCITLARNSPARAGEPAVAVAVLKDDGVKGLPRVVFTTRPRDDLFSGPTHIIDIHLEGEAAGLVEKLRRGSVPLGELAEVRTGVMGFDYWALADFIREGPFAGAVRVATNGCLDRYAFIWEARVKLYRHYLRQPYLDLNCPRLNLSTRRLFQQPKLVLRGVARRLSAVLDEEGIGLLVAVHCAVIADPDRFQPRYVLALLNSRLLDWYHRVKYYPARIPEGSLRYPVSFFKAIPIPLLPPAAQQPLVSLAGQVLAARQAGQATAALERQIDQVVYEAYGLTPAEVALVEETGPEI